MRLLDKSFRKATKLSMCYLQYQFQVRLQISALADRMSPSVRLTSVTDHGRGGSGPTHCGQLGAHKPAAGRQAGPGHAGAAVVRPVQQRRPLPLPRLRRPVLRGVQQGGAPRVGRVGPQGRRVQTDKRVKQIRRTHKNNQSHL